MTELTYRMPKKRKFTEHTHRQTNLPAGIVLRITNIAQKATFYPHYLENYILKFKEFTDSKTKFTFSHSLESVEKMLKL